jgi:hypothetical protein
VEYWVYLNNLSLSYPVIITVGPSGGQWNWALSFLTTTLNPRLGMKYNGNNLNSSIAIAGVQTWSHVAFSFNRTSAGAGTGYLFVNGQPGGSMAVTGLTYSAAETVRIAGYTNVDGRLDGYIRDLRVVQGGVVPVATFTPGAAPFSYASPGYVANMGTTVFTLLGQFVTYPSGKFGSAINFANPVAGYAVNGTPSNVCVQYNALSSLGLTMNSFTISYWLNPSYSGFPLALVGANPSPMTLGLSGYNLQNQIINSSGVIYWFGNGLVSSLAAIPVGTWSHHVLTSSNTNINATTANTVMTYYINSVLQNSSNLSVTGNFVNLLTLAGRTDKAIGFAGLIDDLRIYNTALTSTQVQSVYSSQGAPAPSRAMPLPKYAWDFQSSNVDYVSSLSPTTSVGPPTYNSAGKYGSSIVFNNTPGATPGTYYLKYTTGISLSTASGFTVCAWIKPLAVGVSGNQTFLSIAGQNTFFIFQIDSSATDIHLYGQNPFTVPNNINGSAFSVTQSTWIHAVMVFSGTSITTYFNGTLKDSLSLVVSPVTFNALGLGNRSAISADSAANGELDDLRIFDRALTSAQVQSIYNQQGVPGRGAQIATHLLSLIPSSPVFMQTFGTSSVPTSEVYGAPLTSAGSPTMYLDATRGYVFPATGTTYMSSNFNLPVSYSKSIWVYLTGAPGTGNLLSSTNVGTNGVHYFWFGGTASVGAGHNSGTSVNTYVSDPGTITLNQWTHYVLTYDNPSTTMKLYRDGIQVAQATNAAMSWTGGNAVGICHYAGGNTLTNGRVDNPIIYNRALTAAEVSLLYTSQLNNPTLGETTAGLAYNPIQLTGTPLFTQLSPSATSSAVGAFSLRAVNGTTANAVNVRNGTTSATQDFYADRLGNLLTAPVVGQSLANWLGGATGYVTTWYDQSGRGNHATQTTAANQPVIQRATKGPGYMLVFNAAAFLTGFSYTVLNNTNYSVCQCERRTASVGGPTSAFNDNPIVTCGTVNVVNQYLHNLYRNGTTYLHGQYSNDSQVTVSTFTSSAAEPIRYGYTMRSSTSGSRIYVYNDPLGAPITATNAGQTGLLSMSGGNLQIGRVIFSGITTYYIGEIYELLVFTQSLYDLDTSGGLITQVYQNQLSYTGT